MKRASAFTLIELLCVVGIVAALAGLLLPALGTSRRASRSLQCASNLRQWAAAAQMYAAENRGFLPRRGQGQQPTTVIDRPQDWFNALPPLLDLRPYRDLAAAGAPPAPHDRGVWVCPEEPVEVSDDVYVFTYGMNMWLSTWFTPAPDRIDRVGDATTMVFMADAPPRYCSVLPAAAPYSPVARHSGRVNIAFLDGHVASFAGPAVGCGAGDPRRPDVRWVVPGSPWGGPRQ